MPHWGYARDENQFCENQRWWYVYYSSYGLICPSAHSIQMHVCIYISLQPPFSSKKTHQSPWDHGWNLNTKKLSEMITLKEWTFKEQVRRMEIRQGFLLTTALMGSISLEHASFPYLSKQSLWKKQGLWSEFSAAVLFSHAQTSCLFFASHL